jgi:tripartite-type tricarboxylate transporter receptor subunit TctC
MLSRRDVIVSAGLALIAGARRAQAQGGYSDRPIRILVGYPAGGGVDIVARLFAEPIKAARPIRHRREPRGRERNDRRRGGSEVPA